MASELENRGGLVAAPTRRAHPRLHPTVLVAIAAGGALGAAARYELSITFPPAAGGVPWTTLAINTSGSFVLGVLLTLILERWPPTRYARPFLAIGFLGAYTTFSTFAVESDLLVKDGHADVALAYAGLSVVLGLVAAYVGIVVGRARPVRRRGTIS
jgi:CrcB protein